MKWMLLVFLVQNPLLPVETGMIFDSLDDCLKAEDTMRANYARAYNDWLTWAKTHQAEADYPTSDDFMKKRMGIETWGTCIPHPAAPTN